MADLLAVYDFAKSRISFDFLSFLVLADIHRRRLGADAIDLLLVPGDGDGFHPNVQYDLDQKRWRLRNIVMDSAPLLSSCASILRASSRDHARRLIAAHDGPVFPRGYALDDPLAYTPFGAIIMHANFGDDIQVLRASEQARAYARQWLEARSGGRRAVSLTLREASFNAQRNVGLRDWRDFARHLEQKGYFPFILRDIETALDKPPPDLDGVIQCPAAVFNVDLRLALYELCYFNVFVFNGPLTLAMYGRPSRFLAFAVGDEFLNPQSAYLAENGFAFGESPAFLTRLRHYAWRNPALPALIEEFAAMEQRLRAHEAAGCPDDDYDLDPSLRQPPVELARRFFIGRNWQMLDIIAQECEARGLDVAEIRALQAQAHAERNELASAEQLFRRAIKLKGDGGLEEACELLRQAIDRRPTEVMPYLELGTCLEDLGKNAEAADVYHLAVSRQVASPEIVYRLGCVAQSLGALDDARACFEMLLARSRGFDASRVRARLAELDAPR